MDPGSSNSLALPAKRKTPPEQQQQHQQHQQGVETLETHHLYRRLFYRPQPVLQQQRTDLQVVQSLLELCPLRVSASELVSEKLGARALRLDDSRQQQHKRKQQQQQQQQQRSKQKHSLKLSRTQAKRLGLFDVAAEFGCSSSSSSSRHRRQQQQQQQQLQPNGLTLSDLLPLCQLWQQYALSVCGVEATTAATTPAAADISSSSRGGRNNNGGGAAGLAKLSAFSRCGAAAQMDLHGAWLSVHRSTCPSLCGIAGLVVLDTQQCFLLLGADGRARRVPKSCCVFLMVLADGSSFYLHGQHLLHAPAARSKVKLKPKRSLLL